ncbi:MAG: SAM-dependent methyltransferase [Acidimicrobiales bacterium]
MTLKAVLAELAVDPAKLAGFLADPVGTLEAAGVPKEDLDAVQSGNRDLVYARLTGERPFSTAPVIRPGRARGTGSLVVVGTGIRALGQLTVEAISHIRMADKVFYVVSDPVAEELIEHLNPKGAESLLGLYRDGRDRSETYRQMVDRVLSSVRDGLRTCLACYGHPGVFVIPSHAAIRQARAEGFSAHMLPGISAEDCLFADLGIDPARAGCQTYEATDFLLSRRVIDPSCALILWQVGVMDWAYRSSGYSLAALPLLLERLFEYYRPDHPVVVYEAAVYAGCEAVIKTVPLLRIGEAALASSSTLFIPPARPPQVDPFMQQRLAMHVPR